MSKQENAVRYKGSEFIRAASGSTKDIMTVLLKPDQLYTEAEVGTLADIFLKKEVQADGRRDVVGTK